MMGKWVITLVSIGLLSACSSHHHPQSIGISVDSEFQQILVGDGDIASKVKVEDIATEPVNDRVRGVVRIKSLSLNDEQIQYRFYWYDKKGVEINSKTKAWKLLTLRGGDQVSLSEVSLSPQGENFRLQIREFNYE